ncbi:MAG: 6-hydroxymethylpterin diphosphokinase MptE-like protein [bacterium]
MHTPTFQHNLEALATRAPDLARRLATHTIEQSNRFEIFTTVEKVPGLAAVSSTGEKIPLHHPQQPLTEVAAWLKGLPKECFHNTNVLILGVGLAYHIHQFVQCADPETLITVTEPDCDLFAAVLGRIDLSPLLGSDRVTWHVGLSPHEIVREFSEGPLRHRLAGQGLQLLSLPGFRAYYADYLRTLTEEIQAGLIEVQIKHRTIRLQARIILKNVLENLPAVMEAPGVTSLRSLGAGMPAFVVAPGPTLVDQLSTLRTAFRKGFVIAVDTAARILRREGVPYHFVVAVDHTDLNRLHFDNAADDPGWLAAYPGLHPSIPALYPRRSFFFDHLGSTRDTIRASPLLEFLGLSNRLGSLLSLGSTTDAAYHLARHLACCPIVLVGADMAFPGKRFYAAGAMQEETDVDSPHTQKQYLVPDNRGGQVTTSHIYRMFRDNLSEVIRCTGGLVYNTSMEGAAIQGVSPVNLKEFVEKTADVEPCLPDIGSQSTGDIVIPRIEGILEGFDEDRLVLRRWEKEARRVDVRDRAKFQSRIVPILKEIAEALETRDSIRLAASQAEGSASEILGQVHGVGLLGGTGSRENDVAKDRIVKWIREIRDGVDFSTPLFRETLHKLQIVREGEAPAEPSSSK